MAEKIRPKEGIDISKWQGTVDFTKVKKHGVEFAILRSSFRKTTDPKFFEYVEGCKANDIPILGIYHFIYALNDEDALAEAKYCVSMAEKAQLNKETTIIFSDFEYDSVTNAAKRGVTLGKSECNRFTKIFCEYVKSKGYMVGIYTNQDYYKHWYDQDLLDSYFVWLADYDGEPNYACLLQQYTSKGKIDGIIGNVDLNRYFGRNTQESLAYTRQSVVNLIRSWEGLNEADGSFKSIIDIYNSYSGTFPRGIKMKYTWAWCACTWSALAIKLGYTPIMPIEISCGELIKAAMKMEIWKENDGYIPLPGDGILYDWDDSGKGENTGWPEHIGVVIEVYEDAGYFVVMEGNYNNSVKKRTMSINGKYIRGFITPKYDNDEVVSTPQISNKDVKTIAREVIAGLWNKGDERRNALEKAGYNYEEVQKCVNEILNGSAVKVDGTAQKQANTITKSVISTCSAKKFDRKIAGVYETTADLYCRNDAGTNKKALCLIPKGTNVDCYGYYSVFNNVKWYYIQFVINGVKYIGFSSSSYLKKS